MFQIATVYVYLNNILLTIPMFLNDRDNSLFAVSVYGTSEPLIPSEF